MALQEIIASPNLSEGVQRLKAALPSPLNGCLYLGFPLVNYRSYVDSIDALLITQESGVIAFVVKDSSRGVSEVLQSSMLNDLYISLRQRLEKNPRLRSKRDLAVPLSVYCFASASADEYSGVEDVVTTDTLAESLQLGLSLTEETIREIQSTIEAMPAIKRQSRHSVSFREGSIGQRLYAIEQNIYNLDESQRRATIQQTDNPERIRGLAGSGKTIVLALRASLLHAKHPDWDIAVTFYTKSLYQQYRSLITRFCYSYDIEPDWEKLRLVHAWGGALRPGLYSIVSQAAGVAPVRFDPSLTIKRPLEVACKSLFHRLDEMGDHAHLFDAILIDEAQDFGPEFFQMVYRVAREPKRIVYAYDELQSLSEIQMEAPEDLFGRNKAGEPNIATFKDTTLRTCYRNSSYVLTVAHALGFGIYRKGGFVQMIPEQGLWEAVGYRVVEGRFEPGQSVSLERAPDASPAYMKEIFGNYEDVLKYQYFIDSKAQATECAETIKLLLESENVKHEDILVVFPDAKTAKSDAVPLLRALAERSIDTHMVGVDASESVFREGSIAVSGSFRAKGNEAPVVFVLNSEKCSESADLLKSRNMLFTSITRSKAVVYIYGVGVEMIYLIREIEAVVKNDFRMVFKVPTTRELSALQQPLRDKRKHVPSGSAKTAEALKTLRKAVESGDLSISELQDLIAKDMRETLGNGGREES